MVYTLRLYFVNLDMASQYPEFVTKFLELTDRSDNNVRLNVGFSIKKKKKLGVEELSRFESFELVVL